MDLIGEDFDDMGLNLKLRIQWNTSNCLMFVRPGTSLDSS